MKIVFLDADGTLFHHTGYIPDSAILACQKAQANGHKICLCTGRQKVEIFGDLKKIDYDGIIAGSGASILVKEQTIQECSFSKKEFDLVHSFLEENQIPALYESSVGLFGYQRTKEKLKELLQEQCGHLSQEKLEQHGLYRLFNQLNVVEDVRTYPINKISFLSSNISYQTIFEELSNTFDIIPATFEPFGKESGEISSKKITKATGMDALIHYYNIDKQNVIAIGDGYNDLCMFEKAATSIAMGNADDKIKQKADHVTTSLTEDGIYNAFQFLQLI